MTRHPLALVALLLALTACSTDPSPPGASDAADVTDVASELAPDVATDVTQDTALDVLDAAVGDAPDVAADVTPEAAADVLDAAVGDASLPADADADAGVDVSGELVDAARDAPADVAASFPSLTAAYTATEIRVLYQSTCVGAGCDSYPVDTVRAPTDCHVDTAGVHFSLQACDASGCRTVSGLMTTGADAGHGSVVVRTLATVTPRLEFGRVYGSPQRQSFHVQFAIDATGASNGASGIPGRTVSPDYGDLWLLGCAVM